MLIKDRARVQATDTCDVCLGILSLSCSSPALPLQFFHFRHIEVPLAGEGTHKVDAVLLVDLDPGVGAQLPLLKDSRQLQVRDLPPQHPPPCGPAGLGVSQTDPLHPQIWGPREKQWVPS